jgi:hypothetical protein
MNLKEKNLEELLVKAGYKQHFVIKGSYVEESYIRTRTNSRFHLYFNRNNKGLLQKTSGKIHLDLFRKHKHISTTDRQTILDEMNYIRSFKEKQKPPEKRKDKEKSTIPRKGIVAPNLKELIKTKVVKRNWYNPMRYIKGKFIYIKK